MGYWLWVIELVRGEGIVYCLLVIGYWLLRIMVKAAIEREESDARISFPEREQARRAASMFNEQ